MKRLELPCGRSTVRKIPVLPEELEELQECREVDNGVVESTGGTTGRGIKRDDTDGYMVTSGISVGEIPEWCRVDGN